MEHHILPTHPTRPHFRVPFICSEAYDGGPYLNYGARIGMPWISPPPSGDWGHLGMALKAHEISTSDQESLYQTWLFFGLLTVLLSPVFRSEDFIEREEDGRFVTTAKLLSIISEVWSAPRTKADITVRMAQYAYAIECLDFTFHVLRSTNDDFNWRIMVSITSVANLVATAVNFRLSQSGLKGGLPAPITYMPPFADEETRQSMLAHGWCRSDISRMEDKFISPQTRVFLSMLDKREPGRSHQECTEQLCQVYQIDPQTYKTKHRVSECECKQVQMDYSAAQRILNDGGIPILSIEQRDVAVHIEVVDSRKGDEYVALSHVWADGLGNQTANSLPECQIIHLAKLADVLGMKSTIDGLQVSVKKPLLVWIDTMCCPVEPPQAKAMAIYKLRETYLGSSHVLVLDAGLDSIKSKELSAHEMLLRIYTSGWTQRLWTLQESVLAKRVWICFADDIVEVDSLFHTLAQSCMKDLRIICLHQDLVVQQVWSRQLKGFHGDRTPQSESLSVNQDLHMLDVALQYRRTSVNFDEPLCISTLLNLPIQEIMSVPRTMEDRMVKLWELIVSKYGGVPRSMILLGYPRLTKAGFGWAPRTLLTNPNETSLSHRETRRVIWADPCLGRLTEEGLRVQWPGYRLKLSPRPIRLQHNPWPGINKTTGGIIPFKTDDTTCYSMIPFFNLGGTSKKQSSNEDAQPTRDRFPINLDTLAAEDCALIRIQNQRIENFASMERAMIGRTRVDAKGCLHFSHLAYAIIIPATHSFGFLASVVEKSASQTLQSSSLETMASSESRAEGLVSEDYAQAIKAINNDISSLVSERLSSVDDYRTLRGVWLGADDAKIVEFVIEMVKQWIWYGLVGERLGTEQEWCLG